MKNKMNLIRAAAMLAGAFAVLTGTVAAAEMKMESMDHTNMAAATPKPTTAVAALDAVRKAHTDLSAIVKAKKLKEVHDASEKLMLAANVLATFSKELPADKRSRLEGAVKNLVKGLDALHDAADEGNQASTEKEQKAVDALITLINAQYPAEAKK